LLADLHPFPTRRSSDLLPRGTESADPVFAGWFALNGNGEMTGTTWIEESGFLEGPLMITNTSSVGVVRDAVVRFYTQKAKQQQADRKSTRLNSSHDQIS